MATTSIRPQKGPAGVEIRNARHSLAALNASKAQLDDRAGARRQGAQGRVRLVCRPGRATASWSASARASSRPASTSSPPAAPTCRACASSSKTSSRRLRATLKGGLGYLRNPGDGYLYACSIGFNVTKGTTPGYVSAGHCGDAGEPVYLEGSAGTGPQWTLGPQIGTFQASNFPNPGQTGNDWSWVAISAGNTQSATVYGWGKGDVTVKGSTAVGVGAAICRSGRTSGWRCGTIEATGVDRQLQHRRDDLEPHPHHRLFRRRRLGRLVHHRPRPGAGRALGRQRQLQGPAAGNRTRASSSRCCRSCRRTA